MDILVYCKDCQSRNSWVRNPVRDIKDINGKSIEYGYKCTVCGHTTLRPANNIIKVSRTTTPILTPSGVSKGNDGVGDIK